jgi:hypothetical protein
MGRKLSGNRSADLTYADNADLHGSRLAIYCPTRNRVTAPRAGKALEGQKVADFCGFPSVSEWWVRQGLNL